MSVNAISIYHVLNTHKIEYKLEHKYFNTFILQAESYGHSKALGKQEKRAKNFQSISARYFKEDVTLFERLKHLRVNENWDN